MWGCGSIRFWHEQITQLSSDSEWNKAKNLVHGGTWYHLYPTEPHPLKPRKKTVEKTCTCRNLSAKMSAKTLSNCVLCSCKTTLLTVAKLIHYCPLINVFCTALWHSMVRIYGDSWQLWVLMLSLLAQWLFDIPSSFLDCGSTVNEHLFIFSGCRSKGLITPFINVTSF